MQSEKRKQVTSVIAYIAKYVIWLLALLVVNLLMVFLLWVEDSQSFEHILPFVIASSVMLYIFVMVYVIWKERKREQAFMLYFAMPNEMRKQELENRVYVSEKLLVETMTEFVSDCEMQIKEQQTQLTDYEEYVEIWAHEIKTPVALLSLMVDNRQDELPPDLVQRFSYIRNQIQQYSDQMLYYAKIKGAVKDYYMESLNIAEMTEEILYQFKPDFEERKIQVMAEQLDTCVFTDERGFSFILGQLINNAVKYTDTDGTGRIWLFIKQTDEEIQLHVKDNGVGVKSYDMPFIFRKGFTGESGNFRKKATGMGLYFVHEIAKDLNIRLEVNEKYTDGFEIILGFPVV